MYWLELRYSKSDVEDQFKSVNLKRFQKYAKAYFIDRIDEKNMISLQKVYWLYCYYKPRKSSNSFMSSIKEVFDNIFDIPFDEFHRAIQDFRDKDFDGKASDSGRTYTLRRTTHQSESEKAIYRELESNDFKYLHKIISLQNNIHPIEDLVSEIKRDSWTIFPNKKLYIKQMDKSSFIHHGTGIPKELRKYFEIDNLNLGKRKNIVLEYMNIRFDAYFELLKTDRSRLMWHADFEEAIIKRFPEIYADFKNEKEDKNSNANLPELRFLFLGDGLYSVEFISDLEIREDIDSEEAEENKEDSRCKEGKTKYSYGKRYERNPKNRKKAIELHGTTCKVCGFDFEKIYGERGKGYIEIHHINPLSQVDSEHPVNPKTDLIPICSNCHRMIHRKKESVLSISEIKAVVST